MEAEDKRIIKRVIIGIVLFLAITAIVSRGCGFFDKVIDPNRAVDNYEQFYTLYEGCEQVCSDLQVAEKMDSISGGFTKTERIIGLENKLNNLIKEYNAASKAWTKSMWKADDLPHTLNRDYFYCK